MCASVYTRNWNAEGAPTPVPFNFGLGMPYCFGPNLKEVEIGSASITHHPSVGQSVILGQDGSHIKLGDQGQNDPPWQSHI